TQYQPTAEQSAETQPKMTENQTPQPTEAPAQPAQPLEEKVVAASQPVAHLSQAQPTTAKKNSNGRFTVALASVALTVAAALSLYQWGQDLVNYSVKQTGLYQQSQAKVSQLEENERNTICSQLAANLTRDNVQKFDQYLNELIQTGAGGKLGVNGPQNICRLACYNELQRGDDTATEVILSMCIDRLFDTHSELMNRPANKRQIDVYFPTKTNRGKQK
ncbi:MAG: hypothetical protein COU07_04205, partial [Candidatus Harrisonbacteria bacterium CG10_big_fil_rev_8_21_14_0_10_40_38]